MFNNEEVQNTNGAARLFSTIVGAAIRAFLAVTTAGFFYMYGGDIWSWILPYPMANYMAAITGIALVDGLAFAWTYLRRASADTEEQQNYAKMGAWLDMALSLTVTAVFIILTTPLLAASVSADTLTVLLNLASWMGIIVGVVSFAGNGLIWHFYDNASSSSVEQLNKNEMRAFMMKVEHALDMKRLKMQANKTVQQITEALPGYTSTSAQQSTDGYLQQRFAQVDTNNDGFLDMGEIEQAALEIPDTPPMREYSREEREARLSMSAQTRPAPATVEQPTAGNLYNVDVLENGMWQRLHKDESELNANELAQNYASQGKESRVMHKDDAIISYAIAEDTSHVRGAYTNERSSRSNGSNTPLT